MILVYSRSTILGTRVPVCQPSEEVMKRSLVLMALLALMMGSQVLAQVPRTVLAEHLTATW
jgi:hypothetical protein